MNNVIVLIEEHAEKVFNLRSQKVPNFQPFNIYGEDNMNIGTEHVVEALKEMDDSMLTQYALELKNKLIADMESFGNEISQLIEKRNLDNEEIDESIGMLNEELENALKDVPEAKLTRAIHIDLKQLDEQAINALKQVYVNLGLTHVQLLETVHTIYFNPNTPRFIQSIIDEFNRISETPCSDFHKLIQGEQVMGYTSELVKVIKSKV